MSDYANRIEEFRGILGSKGIQGAIILTKENICYLSGFCVGGIERLTALVIDQDGAYLVVPKLSQGQIEDVPVDRSFIWDDQQDPYEIMSSLLEKSTAGRFATESSMPLSRFLKFYRYIGESPSFVDGILEAMRGRKRNEEIQRMRKAVEISERALEATLNEISTGISEIELAGILEHNMRRMGSDGSAFSPTIASGKNSANPHHITSDKKLEIGDAVVIDFGASYRSYASDQTRTIVLDHAPTGFEEVYNVVKEAQQGGIDFAKPGIPAGDIDDHVRKEIVCKGFGNYFTHRTGHGIGLEVHEPPYINTINREPLVPPVTFTIEPGIYILGKYGVRIEDTILLDSEGAVPINKFTKELIAV